MKTTYIVLGVVVVGALAYYLYTKNKTVAVPVNANTAPQNIQSVGRSLLSSGLTAAAGVGQLAVNTAANTVAGLLSGNASGSNLGNNSDTTTSS